MFEYIDSEELIESLQVLFSSNNYGKRIVFSSVFGCRIKGIIWKLEEVLINLIMNSVEASPENSMIDVRCFAENGELVIKVEDRGCGIAQDYMSRVFDPFFTTKEVGKGTGMGLYICYNIVKMHGGSIRIENREGGGTVVTVAIPGECGDERKDTDN